MTTQMGNGGRGMCNLSEGLYERAEAFAQRRAQELLEEKTNTMVAEMTREMYRNIAYRLRSKGLQKPEIADMMNIGIDEVHELLSEPLPT